MALLGYGGFHLACDATQGAALAALRARKGRPAKPFAVLVPDLETARQAARLAPEDEALLAGPSRAVVLAPRRPAGCAALRLAEGVAPGIADLGLLLPCAPLHWLLLFAPGTAPGRGAPRFPALVLTSANASGEPTLHRRVEARAALRGLADLVVEHDREVLRPNDDPVFRSAPSGPIPIRLSRGSAPLVLRLPAGLRAPLPVAALGGELKCAPALAAGGEILVGEHVGDLASVAAADAARERLADLARLAGVVPAVLAHDLHPDGVAGALAREIAPRRSAVQHHHAHAAACLLEHGRHGPALALTLDGLGYGSDGTLWGGSCCGSSSPASNASRISSRCRCREETRRCASPGGWPPSGSRGPSRRVRRASPGTGAASPPGWPRSRRSRRAAPRARSPPRAGGSSTRSLRSSIWRTK